MDPSVQTIQDVLKILPHRYPFLLVDRVLELEAGKRCLAIKNVTINEPHLTGHWPGLPIMPGVLILEAMAQVGGIMLLCQPEDAGLVPVFGGVDSVRWRKQVTPGDQLIIEATLDRRKGPMGRATAVAKVDGEIACEGVFTFILMDRTVLGI